jgi:tripartite-type tricarboxylate transporter receptor subunit TctC
MAPDIPTFVELGYPDLIGENWLGISGPAGMPRDIVERLHREVMLLAKEPTLRDAWKSSRSRTVRCRPPSSPITLRKVMRAGPR